MSNIAIIKKREPDIMCFLMKEHSNIFSLDKRIELETDKTVLLSAASSQELQKPKDHIEWSHDYRMIILGNPDQINALSFSVIVRIKRDQKVTYIKRYLKDIIF